MLAVLANRNSLLYKNNVTPGSIVKLELMYKGPVIEVVVGMDETAREGMVTEPQQFVNKLIAKV
jgi:hypothetical protein